MSGTEWKNSLRRRFDAGVESLAETYPRGYLLAATALALLGHCWLLLFPWLAMTGISGGYDALTAQPGVAWSRLCTWSAVTAGSVLVSYRLVRFRPALPAGIALEEKAAPALFKLVDDLRRHYRRPLIDRVVMSGDFVIDIVKTPCSFLPVWSMNTLVIGLPLMQSLSADQLRCALARRLGQFSKRRNSLENWLYQLRRIWPQYRIATGATGPGFRVIPWFFQFYAPLYERVSLPAARRDELAADSYAMEVCSDELVLDTITTETVCRRFLEDKYWPTYRKLTTQVREILPKPHAGMASVLRIALQGEKCQEWLQTALNREPRPDDVMPSLAERVANIGHREPRMSGIAPASAATVYLGTAIGELDAAPDLALSHFVSQERARCPPRFQPRTLISSLTHRLKRPQTTRDTAVANSHSHITPFH
jgi:hypothetical protein